MHWSMLAAAAAVIVSPLAAAHPEGGPSMPKLFGAANVNLRDLLPRAASTPNKAPRSLERRAPECGINAGGVSCGAGLCCSEAGYCGSTNEYCRAPDCQWRYGPGCDANEVPTGSFPVGLPRSRPGSVVYGGEGIYPCQKANTVAITYDDGPYQYTAYLLDLLASYKAKATFFVTGNNLSKGHINDPSTPWPALIQRMISEGHQVASHTWSHQNLDSLTETERIEQMAKLEMAVGNIIGKYPTYMRPPYSACQSAACKNTMYQMGYHISYFDLDTDDYNQNTADKIQNSKDIVRTNLAKSQNKWLAIAHDIHYQTTHNLTQYMLDQIASKGYQAVTQGECLNDPEANWYRSGTGSSMPGGGSGTSTSTGSSSPSSTATGTVSTNGKCGAANGNTICQGSSYGNCCSQHGWCGSTTDHCSTGCQSAFGTCSGGGSSGSSSSSAAPQPSASAPVSTDGTCGSANGGKTCLNSAFGNCCSQHGWCGSTTDHCGTSCQSAFGTCSGSGTGSSSAAPQPSAPVSNDGTCGSSNGGKTCKGSAFGNCCSQYGWCGSTTGHCTNGCQSAFGTCS